MLIIKNDYNYNNLRLIIIILYSMLSIKEKVFDLIKQGNKYPQQTESWIKKRHDLITATNVASIIGCNPNKSWGDLLKEKSNPSPPLFFSNKSTEHGNKYEPIARNIYEIMNQCKVHECGLLIHPEYPWLGASPDGIRECGTLLEIKCLHKRRQVSEIPAYYKAQVQIQLQVTKMKRANLFQCKFIEVNKDKYDEIPGIEGLQKGIGKHNGYPFYWYLEDYSNKLIERNDEWFKFHLIPLENFYKIFMTNRNKIISITKTTNTTNTNKTTKTTKKRSKITNTIKINKTTKKRSNLYELQDCPAKRTRSMTSGLFTKSISHYMSMLTFDIKKIEFMDLNEWVSATETRNYMIRDSILDYCDRYGEMIGLQSDNNKDIRFDFNIYIKKQGTAFEGAIVENLKKRFLFDNRTIANTIYEALSEDNVKKTKDAIMDGVPIIFQAVFHNKSNKTYGIADILVRSDYLNYIFERPVLNKKEISKRAPNLPIGKNYHYRVVDIKFKSLYFTNSGNRLKNEGTMRASKAQVIIYNMALAEIQGYLPPTAYLLGRRTVFKNEKICNPFCKPGPVNMSELEIVNETHNAIQWRRDLKQHGSTWSLSPPTREELLPNMSNRLDYPYHNVKKELAIKSKDITSLWNCGIKERKIMSESGITKWSDPKCTGEALLGKSKRGETLQQILDCNRLNKMVLPKKLTKKDKKNISKFTNIEFFVDFETVNDVNDNFDHILDYKPIEGKETNFDEYNGIIYMIGLGWSYGKGDWQYECYLVNDLTYEEEKRIIKEWFNKMIELRGDHEMTRVYHWTHAEISWLNRVLKRTTDLEKCHIQWYDLHELFTKIPITLYGVFDFKLKAIAKGLYRMGLIKTDWNSTTVDGIGAMMMAWYCYKNADKDTDIAKLPEMIDVIKYNEVDCKVLWEIINWLRNW